MARLKIKIFYPAGFVSIILLPIFCIWNLNLTGRFDKVGAIDVGYFYHNEAEEYSSKKFLEKIKSARIYNEIVFNGNEINDRAILKRAEIKVATIVNSRDTINGVLFKLTDKVKYQSFVSAIDISQYKEIQSIIDGDNIWIFYTKPAEVKSHDYFFCGTNEISRKIEMNSEKTEAFQQFLQEKTRSFLLLTILFLLMCLFAFRKIKFL
ncbi:MAG: hypothetical protein EOO87_19170 [Pedobacter sp.]|nr:MAG: hypothetical protein EOO87_19170 [Pedobacter sp.]